MTAMLTYEHFDRELHALESSVQARDPRGLDLALRIGIAQALFLQHDRLRSEERPFDRRAFAEVLGGARLAADRASNLSAAPADGPAGRPEYEAYVSDLYSRCWAKYDDEEFLRTADLFEERLRANDVDTAVIARARCLDAGCGSGRYTLALVRAGAASAVGVDISDRAVAEARERAARLGFGDAVTFQVRSVIDLPADWTGTFDLVVSNGVVHHTPDPVRGLHEISRVLRPGGTAFIMVYGKGGLFWRLVDTIRALVSPVPLDFADAWLQMAGIPVGKIFFCLDHWYTPYQERVDQCEFEARLGAAGFARFQYLPRARIYDSSERLVRYPEEADLIGTPDLRYLAQTPA